MIYASIGHGTRLMTSTLEYRKIQIQTYEHADIFSVSINFSL